MADVAVFSPADVTHARTGHGAGLCREPARLGRVAHAGAGAAGGAGPGAAGGGRHAGLVAARTVAMLINEAADAAHRRALPRCGRCGDEAGRQSPGRAL